MCIRDILLGDFSNFSVLHLKTQESFASRLKNAKTAYLSCLSSSLGPDAKKTVPWDLKIRLIFGFPMVSCETDFWNLFAGSALGFRGGETEGRSNVFERSRCLAVGQLTSTFKRDTFSSWSKPPLQNIGQPRRLVSQGAFITSALAAAGREIFGFPLHSSDSTEQPWRIVFQRAFITSALAAAGRENFWVSSAQQ